jgi:hypothetical protein
MPYIDEPSREWLEKHFENVPIKTPGQLNYVITKLVHDYVQKNGVLNYTIINEVMGVFESAKLEFYRTVAAPYEDKKREQNGKVSRLDGHV